MEDRPKSSIPAGKLLIYVLAALLVLALVFAIVLMAISFFMYVKNSDPADPSPTNAPSSTLQTIPLTPTETTLPADTTLPVNTAPTQTVETQPPAYYVDSPKGGLNVRSGPGTDYDVVDRLDHGEQVYPERWEGNWAYIDGAITGWVSGDYLTQAEPDMNLDPEDFLFTHTPDDNSLIGKWMVVSNQYTDASGIRKCRASIIEFKDNGTFSHRVYDFYRHSHSSEWRQSGAESSLADQPHWVGEYTFDGATLQLAYRGIYVEQYETDSNGYSKLVGYWEQFYKRIPLQLYAYYYYGDYYIQDSQTFPMHTEGTAGDNSTEPWLIRVTPGYSDIETLCNTLRAHYY